jgi:hypothetical protein
MGGMISDLKELSAWIIGLASLAILLVFIYTTVRKNKIKT